LAKPDDLKKRIKELLERWAAGDSEALKELIPLVYQDLRRIAGYLFKGERKNHTLGPTIVVHEAFMKLSRSAEIECRDGAHFLAIYSRAMRQILIDYARYHGRRPEGQETVPLDDVQKICRERNANLLALEQALNRLAEIDPRQASVVDLKIFCGLDNEQIAKVLKISANTVMRDWKKAKWRLQREMKIKGDIAS
jgi:RNA polymerase sigma-70 factor (ECF subfamily)